MYKLVDTHSMERKKELEEIDHRDTLDNRDALDNKQSGWYVFYLWGRQQKDNYSYNCYTNTGDYRRSIKLGYKDRLPKQSLRCVQDLYVTT